MTQKLLSKLAVGLVSAALTASVFGADVAPGRSWGGAASEPGATRGAAAPASVVPISNWSAPQFFNPEAGVSSSMPGFMASGITPKAALTLASFIGVTPCRFLDTRAAPPVPPVVGGGSFAAGQVRVYRAPGSCGIPAGNGRLKAVSLAVTTLPTVASGDIEVVSEAQALGSTVVMVIQAGQWNSATTVSGVDNEGDFKVQLRGTPGDVVIDINGYFASVNDVLTNDDYISIVGSYDLGGGLLYVQQNSASGAAINATGNGSAAMLAFGNRALSIQSGGIEVVGAGIQSSTRTAMVHNVNTSAVYGNGAGAGTICAGFPHHSVVNNVFANDNGQAILIVTPVENYNGQTAIVNYPVSAYWASTACSTDGIGHWTIRRLDGAAHVNDMGFNILVIIP